MYIHFSCKNKSILDTFINLCDNFILINNLESIKHDVISNVIFFDFEYRDDFLFKFPEVEEISIVLKLKNSLPDRYNNIYSQFITNLPINLKKLTLNNFNDLSI